MTQRIIYPNEFPYFVTVNVGNKAPLFKDKNTAKILSVSICEACKMKEAIVYCYCILPNHLHLLV